jgi:uncharacterized membrane protein
LSFDEKCVEGLMVKPQQWFGIIVLFTVLTMLSVYAIAVDSPLAIVRYVLGCVFVVSMPGYCLVNVLFLGKNRLDLIEETVLSVALSFGIAGIVGLFLGLSPIGINVTSITVSLSVIVLVLAVVAFIRKRRYTEGTGITSEHVDS